MADLELNGTWWAIPADEDLRRAYPAVGFEHETWERIEVPGHWRSHPAFAGVDGPVLHRRTFEADPPAPGQRRWLELDGVFYTSDVWLDGSYVGDTEGYFVPHAFEITEAMAGRREHVLALEVACSPQRDRRAKRNITGVFQHWDMLDPDWNPGGIWRPLRVVETGAVRITSLRVVCPDATPERAVLNLRVTLDAAEATTVELRTAVGGTDHVQQQHLAAGENRIPWAVTVPDPNLWWPHALGEAVLEDVDVDVVLPGGDVSDRRRVRTGLRQVRMKRWILTVNGERLFLKGSNQGPTRMALAEATPAELERDVVLAKEAGLDLLRLHAHISRPELYAAADRHGLLLWQDFPLQWGYARGIRKQAARQARAAVDLLGHHPSIAIWCGHNEPMALDIEPGAEFDPTALAVKALALQELPTWNKTVLDASVKRAIDKADGTRPVIPHSGVLPHPGSGGTDSHLYFGWYWGDERGLPGALGAWPRLARFVSEFGAQAVPTEAGFMDPEAWPDLDWEALARTHGLQRQFLTRLGLDPWDFETFDEWRDATQRYQAQLVRHHVETLRRLKYRPTGGFCQFAFADSHPAVSWAVLDHTRQPKLGHAALVEACAPVIVVADRPAESYAAGDALALDVHVVSDLRTPITDATVSARLSWTGGEHRWAWAGEVEADTCARISTIQAVVPAAPGPLTLELDLESAAAKASNRYESRIRP